MQLDSSGGIYDPPKFSLVAELSVSARGDEYAEGTRYCRIPDGWSVPAYFSGSYEELEELELNLREGKTVIVAGRLHVYENATNPGEFDLKTWHSIKRHAFALYDASVVNMAPDCADNNRALS